jgi:hypothetical protein
VLVLTGYGLGLFLAAQVGPGATTLSLLRARSSRPSRQQALNPLTIALWTVSFPAAAPAHATSSGAAAASLLVGGLGTLT